MATIISTKTSGVGGLQVTPDASGILQLASNNGTTALTIDASQNVGIGTSSPAVKLSVSGSGVPVIVNSSDNTYGIKLSYSSDTSVSYLGTFGGAFYVANSSGSALAGISSAGLFQFNSGYGSVATAYGCRAWVNFNGSGTVAIRSSGNVTSITDNGTGYYTVNMTNAMPDTNYNAVGAASSSGSQFNICFFNINPSTGNRNTPTTSAFTVGTGTLSAMLDGQDICVSVFR